MARKLGKTELCVAVAWAVACAASVAGTSASASSSVVPSSHSPASQIGAGKAGESSQLAPSNAESTKEVAKQEGAPESNTKPVPDLTARKRAGKASFYGKEFFGKKMADGAPMDPQGDNAASRTLPLGTTAKVTNVETGKTAVVTIEDRGPYVDGRLVDLSPGTAAKIGLTPKQGLTNVVVAPIAVPLPNGEVKAGAAAHEPEDKPDKAPVSNDKPIRLADNKAAFKNERLAVEHSSKVSQE
jgi:rare lipoprotein A